QGPQEGFRSQVLGEGLRPRAVVDEPVHRAVVVVVELSERLAVAAAGELDEGDQPAALGLGLLRGGGLVGVAVPFAGVSGNARLAEQHPRWDAGRLRTQAEDCQHGGPQVVESTCRVAVRPRHGWFLPSTKGGWRSFMVSAPGRPCNRV